MKISNIMEGTGQELLHHLEQFPHEYFRLVPLPNAQTKAQDMEAKEPVEEDAVSKMSNVAVSPNEGMLAALREIAERQQGRRHSDGSETERLLREGRAGAMWGHEANA